MTKHELAAATWREMRDDLVDRSPFGVVPFSSQQEDIDAVMIAMIENSYVEAVAAVEADTEDPICSTEKTVLTVTRLPEGRVQVTSLAFVDDDLKVTLRPGEAMVIRPKEDKAFITKRQG